MTKSKKPKILHSGSYWREFHRRRAERRARAANYGIQGEGGSRHPHYHNFDTLQSPPLIVTFIPNREAPLYTHVQNNGSLVTSYDPLSIQPTPSATHGKETDPPLPARREPLPPYNSSRRRSATIQRAEE
jgi:hypothetical protein